MHSLFGTSIHLSPLATTRVPIREHKRRRGQSLAYHLRVRKKWVKRFGWKQVPGCYQVAGIGMVMHPDIFARLEAATTMPKGGETDR